MMRADEDPILRREGLAFFGRIVAGQSHEVTNVLNIINELAGLQQDVLTAGVPQVQDAERLNQVAGKIRTQVQRGQSIVRAVNWFAHCVDHAKCVCDLKESIEQATYLAQRAARLAKTTLVQKYPDESIAFETSHFGLIQTVYTCIEIALSASSEIRQIDISYEVIAGGAEISVTSGDTISPAEVADDKQTHLKLLVQELGGRLVTAPGAGDGHQIKLFIPRQPTGMPIDTTAPDGHKTED